MTPSATPRSALDGPPAVTLDLRPRPRDLPNLAAVQTRAFGLAGRVPIPRGLRHAGAYRAAVNVWVLLAAWPTLLMLCASTPFGWVAAADRHAVAEIRPLHRPRGDLVKLVALAVVLGTPIIVLALTAFLVPLTLLAVRTGQAWVPAAAGGLVVGPGLVDTVYRLWGPVAVDHDLVPSHSYLLAGVAAWPQHIGHGTALMKRICEGFDRRPGEPLVLACRPELVDFYTPYGFEQLAPSSHTMMRTSQSRPAPRNPTDDAT